jgi:hypothetical protein
MYQASEINLQAKSAAVSLSTNACEGGAETVLTDLVGSQVTAAA